MIFTEIRAAIQRPYREMRTQADLLVFAGSVSLGKGLPFAAPSTEQVSELPRG